MSAKSFVFVFCVQALVQITLGQCLYRPGFAADTILGAPYGLAGAGYNGLAAGGYGLAGGLINNGLAYNGLAAGFGANALAYDGISAPALEITATSGGALPVSSASPVPPAGIALASDNAYEGALAVAGELPFLGTVAMEGVVPSAGVGAVNHACGNGRNAMISENAAFAPTAYGPAIAPGFGFASGNVFNQGIGAFGPAALSSAAPFGYGPVSGAYSGLAPYGGIGEGNVAVAGELPVAGTTAVAGQVPIMGAVSFGGGVPAAGAVSISGACDCGASYLY